MENNNIEKLVIMAYQYNFQDDEEIKEITNYNSNERYFVSNYGNVISLCNSQWKIIKPLVDKEGYLFVGLWYNGKRVNRRIHQLVAEYFIINDSPQEKKEIHHIDCNILNNKASNLMYISSKEHRELHNARRKNN